MAQHEANPWAEEPVLQPERERERDERRPERADGDDPLRGLDRDGWHGARAQTTAFCRAASRNYSALSFGVRSKVSKSTRISPKRLP
jgi:hypothetical protein